MQDNNITIEDLSGGIKNVIFDQKDKPFNVFNESMIISLNKCIDQLEGDDSLKGIVFSTGKKDFIVGADISEIESIKSVNEAVQASKFLQSSFNRIEQLKVPTVSAISGQCFGGGLEFVLCCTYRIASDYERTLFSFPEVMLGLLPGAGGTQRTPKLIGIQNALDLMLTGKKINARKAKKIELIDDIVPLAYLLDTACRKILTHTVGSGSSTNFSKFSTDLPRWATDKNTIGRKIMESKAKEILDKQSNGHYPAPYKILDVVFNNYDKTLEEGLEDEASLFGRLSQTRECHSLIHVFHCVTSAKKVDKHLAEKPSNFSIKNGMVGVIGGGLMGGGIAQICAFKGIKSRISDPNTEALGKILQRANDNLDKKLQRKRITEREKRHTLNLISLGLDQSGLANCDVVIEAVFEDLDLKKKILKEALDKNVEGQVVATNTSAIPISTIKKDLPHKEKVLGMHFFSPVEKMPLLEIVRCEDTPDWVLEKAFSVGSSMGKNIIVVNDGPGFYTTRILAFYLGEAVAILEEGNDIDVIDSALVDFGFPVGPISLIDEVGIDVGCHVLSTISEAFPGRLADIKAAKLTSEPDRLGKKSEKGFYKYLNGKRLEPDYDFISSLRKGAKSKDSDLHSHDIIDRCMLMFVNEAFRCLEEGIIREAKDGDLGAVFGLGFPAFWGGPFKYVDHLGANTIVERLNSLAQKFGERFTPCGLLLEYADTHKKLF